MATQVIKEYDVAVCGSGVSGGAAVISDDFSAIDIKKLQTILESDGVTLHERDIL